MSEPHHNWTRSVRRSGLALLGLAVAVAVFYWLALRPVPQVAYDRHAAVIVVTHDHRALDVFNTHYEMEDGRLRRQGQPLTKSESPTAWVGGARRCLKGDIPCAANAR